LAAFRFLRHASRPKQLEDFPWGGLAQRNPPVRAAQFVEPDEGDLPDGLSLHFLV
jgi:hypothetical protein